MGEWDGRTPIELIKCRMQVQMLAREGAFGSTSKTSPPPLTLPFIPAAQTRHVSTTTIPLHAPRSNIPPDGPISLITSTIRKHGLRGLWLGQMGTLVRETGGSAAWFTTYEVASKAFISYHQTLSDLSGSSHRITKKDLATWELMCSGALAGMAYNIVLFPADSVKSGMQTWAEIHPDKPRLTFGETGKRIWRTRGLRGMYAGCGLTVARAAPSSAMIFAIYETMEKRFGNRFE